MSLLKIFFKLATHRKIVSYLGKHIAHLPLSPDYHS